MLASQVATEGDGMGWTEETGKGSGIVGGDLGVPLVTQVGSG